MHLKSLLGGIAIAATVAGAQAPAAQTKAPTKAQTNAAGYKKEMPAALMKKAKVAESAAAAAALAKVPGGVIQSVELEEEDGKLIYSYDIRLAGKKGIGEIHVDAMTGAVIKSAHEDPAAEKAEKAEDAAKDAKMASKVDAKKPVPTKKPLGASRSSGRE